MAPNNAQPSGHPTHPEGPDFAFLDKFASLLDAGNMEELTTMFLSSDSEDECGEDVPLQDLDTQTLTASLVDLTVQMNERVQVISSREPCRQNSAMGRIELLLAQLTVCCDDLYLGVSAPSQEIRRVPFQQTAAHAECPTLKRKLAVLWGDIWAVLYHKIW